MSALVGNRRPNFSTAAIKSGEPISAADWATLGGIANWCNGHGGMLIPWTGISCLADDETRTFHFYVGPKARAVERIWAINVRGSAVTSGALATITAGSAAAVDVTYPTNRNGRTGPIIIREPLAAKTSTAGGTSISIFSGEAVQVQIESVAMFEQTRAILDQNSTDYGVDLTSLRPRQPIVDLDFKSVAGVMDAYKNLDARRSGLFHWSVDTASALAFTSSTPASILPLGVPIQPAVALTTQVTVAVYAKTNAGTSHVDLDTTVNNTPETIDITSTSYAWATATLGVAPDDLAEADGRPGGAWEELIATAYTGAGATELGIAAVSVIRTTTPI